MTHFIRSFLAVSAIVFLLQFGSVGGGAWAGTIAHFDFEGDLEDISGNGAALFQTGPVGFSNDVSAFAPGGQAVRIAPQSFLDSTVLLPPRDYTVEFFVKAFSEGHEPEGLYGVHILEAIDYTQSDGDPQGGFSFVTTRTDVFTTDQHAARFIFAQPNVFVTETTSVYAPTDLLDDSWHHIALTLSAELIQSLYVDGDLVGSVQARGEHTSSAFPIRIGAGHFFEGPAGFFNGLIDELRVSDTALSPDQFLLADTPSIPVPATALIFGFSLSVLGLLAARKKSRTL